MIAQPAISIVPSTAARAVASMDLRIVDPTNDPTWDTLLWTHPHSTFFHSAAWAKTLADAYGFQSRYVVATSGDELRGLLPMMEARSWLCGTRGVSLPFTDECAPLVTPGVTAESLLGVATHEGQARGWKFLELRGGHELLNGVPESTSFHGHVLRFYGHVLGLNAKPEDAFEKFDASVQRNIRKAEREGVAVEFGTDLESVRAYYALHCRTRTKHGAPPQPFRFFESLCANILEKGHGFVALAKHQGRAIAGAVFFRFARTAIYKFSASDDRFQELRGPNMVIWQSIRRLIDAGVMEFDFGKTSRANEGLRRFKSQWGAEERVIRYIRYDFSSRRFIQIPDLAAGAQAPIVALMPVFLSRWIGRAVYPHLT
jgi:CelD/BcsL family acetyltransferase involved in cellulose biosynthesis